MFFYFFTTLLVFIGTVMSAIVSILSIGGVIYMFSSREEWDSDTYFMIYTFVISAAFLTIGINYLF